MDTNLEEFIRYTHFDPGAEDWAELDGGIGYKFLETDRFGNLGKVIVRLDEKVYSGKTCYIVGWKGGRPCILKTIK